MWQFYFESNNKRGLVPGIRAIPISRKWGIVIVVIWLHRVTSAEPIHGIAASLLIIILCCVFFFSLFHWYFVPVSLCANYSVLLYTPMLLCMYLLRTPYSTGLPLRLSPNWFCCILIAIKGGRYVWWYGHFNSPGNSELNHDWLMI